MRKFLLLIALIVLLGLLHACKPARPSAVTDLSITIKDGAVIFSNQRILAGDTIEYSINNTTQYDYTFWMLSRPVPEITRITSEIAIHQVLVTRGQTILGKFTSPLAAGEYSIVYARNVDQEYSGSVMIVVVQPEFAH